jgi:DNA helicase II / ATP-dependent DNA helicase PcrA
MTRAKDHLHLILPQRFFAHQQKGAGDRHMYTARTRFIPSSILNLFDNCAWPAAPTTPVVGEASRERIDITSRLRRMWS